MVDYNDPSTVARDFGTYNLRLSQRLASQFNSPIGLFNFNSGTREPLARRRWYIHVSLPALPRLSSRLFTFRTPLHLAGNSLLPLTLSGMSFEGGVHGDGQYGSVVFSLVSCRPPTVHRHNKGLIFTWFRFTHLRGWQPL